MEAERFSTAPGDEGRQGNGNSSFGQAPSLSQNGTHHDVSFSSETSPLIVNAEDSDDENLEDVDETASPQISQAPPDNYYLVFSVFVLVGMTTLLPWNFFISLTNFWDYKFRNVSEIAKTNGSTAKTDLQKEFTSYLSISSTVPNATFVIINALVGQRFSLMRRLTLSLSMMIVMFTIITVLAFVDTDSWQRPFLITILSLVVIVNINSAIFQGGSFGMAGKFPDRYMSAQMLGQAIGGVFPALVDICIVSLDVKEEDVGSVCFAIATVVLFLCITSLIWALRTPFFKFYYETSDRNNESTSMTSSTTSSSSPSTLKILKLSWVYLLCIFVTFSVTLTIFPSVAVLIKSETSASGSDWATKYFTAVSVFLLFNMGDLFGRGLASWIKMPGQSKFGKVILLIATFSRILFIPLFLNCNIDSDKPRTVIFKSDADFIAFMGLFAVSNGYIGNICMLHGPKSTPEKELQEAIALILIAGLVVGTGVGSFLSYPIVASL